MDEHVLKQKLNKSKRPQNLELHNTRVNPEIWSALEKSTRAADSRLRQVHGIMRASMFNVSSALSRILPLEGEDMKEIRMELVDGGWSDLDGPGYG